MEILTSNLLAVLSVIALTAPLVHPQDQSGFISLDCGISKDSAYTDADTGISYVSDANYTDTGIGKSLSPEFQTTGLPKQFFHVRSFPNGNRSCYTVPTEATKYLIRARFMYGNYDAMNQLPKFELHLGVDVWDSVELVNDRTITTKEIIHSLKSRSIDICLANTGMGTPFISALELRPLENSLYATESGSLVNLCRWDFGSTTNGSTRYKDDIYDRIWSPPINLPTWRRISTEFLVTEPVRYNYRVPSKVMQTAISPLNNANITVLDYRPENPSTQIYFFLHHADIEASKQSREFDVYLNGKICNRDIVSTYLSTWTTLTLFAWTATNFNILLVKSENSTLPPIVNAIEAYMVKLIDQNQTEEEEVYAMNSIRSTYAIKKNWQGDPCAPKAYKWDGLECDYSDENNSRIISLNLSSSGLTGEIAPYICSLTMIQSLDLSYNSLTGPVPDFLSKLQRLRVLNLQGNNLAGSIPPGLTERLKKELLSLRLEMTRLALISCSKFDVLNYINNARTDANLCTSSSCNISGESFPEKQTTGKKFIVPVAASLALLFFIVGASIVLWCIKRVRDVRKLSDKSEHKNGPLESKKRQFTYFEVLTITNNFERIIGRGGFGTVYYGHLDHDAQVAIKLISPSSIQGYEQFITEAELLMRVHHRNLTSLVGYCNEDTKLALIYEFMANGNLGDHLSGQNVYSFDWQTRIQIAIDAAQGLEYLHHGCKPPIIHRDVKSANILLNQDFQAKLGDFGLSRIFPTEGDSHVSTRVIGTPGYLDPEYSQSNRLTEKSDIYSFGVVLLELVTGRPAIRRARENTHISQWVSMFLQSGDIRNMADPRLCGDLDINSVWRVVELGMACVSPSSALRPTMNFVVTELKESLALEVARSKEDLVNHSTHSGAAMPQFADFVACPLAR